MGKNRTPEKDEPSPHVVAVSRSKVPKGKPVGAVVSAVRILRYLSTQPKSISLTQIVRELQLNTSTCFNILRTLERERLITLDPLSKTYAIGFGVFELVQGIAVIGQDINVVRPHLERVATIHDVTVTLWRRISRDRMAVVLAAIAPGTFRVHMNVGQRLPLTLGSGGRIMAAYENLTPVELQKQFSRVRWSHPVTFKEFMKDVTHVQEHGWSEDVGKFVPEVASISVPIFNRDGLFSMACGATMFIGRYNKQLAIRLSSDLKKASRAITASLPNI